MRIVVTPAGRGRYLDLLLAHLAAQKDAFDEWHLWVNTAVVKDIGWAERTAARHEWVKCVYLDDYPHPPPDSRNIHLFFPEDAVDPESAYLRLDDDVVYLEPGCVSRIFEYREAHPEPFLVYANTVNNAVCTWLHQHGGLVVPSGKRAGYACVDDVGWKDPAFAQEVHEAFLTDRAPFKGFGTWVLSDHERVSINAVSWLGRDFAEFDGLVGEHEEMWLSVEKPRALKRTCVILGDALCCHFAFHTQRAHLDASDVLDKYRALMPGVNKITET